MVYQCVTLRSSGKEQCIIWDCRNEDIYDSNLPTPYVNANRLVTSLGDNVLYRYRGRFFGVCSARNMTAAERSAAGG